MLCVGVLDARVGWLPSFLGECAHTLSTLTQFQVFLKENLQVFQPSKCGHSGSMDAIFALTTSFSVIWGITAEGSTQEARAACLNIRCFASPHICTVEVVSAQLA